MFALIITSATLAVAAIPQSERAVLLNLYNQTNGPQTWVNKTKWNGNPGTECTWYGITCDSTGSTVTEINLSGNALYGTLPSLLPLTNLQYFNVSGGGNSQSGGIGNIIVGSIPSLAGMAKLQQFLVNNNQLSGPIPPLTGLAQLTTFDATYNLLTSLPDLTGATNLVYFKVANNVLAGSIPSLSGLINLNYFNVSNNDLVGSVPALNGLTNLSTFNLESNQLTGALPDFSDLRNLTYFEVSQNLLNGQIPDLVGAPNLQYFDVSLNQLTGSLPALSSLMNLQQFGTTGNHLTGKVPPIANLQNLALFDIDYNQQSGPLPSPPSQFASGSPIVRLCPNLLTPASAPASAADAIWSLASGTTPWSLDCSTSPTWMTLTSLTSNLNPSVVGQPVTLTAAVYGMNPTGTVTFTATQALTLGVNTICANVPLVNSLATCTSTTLPTGSTNAIKAQYSGDQNNASSNNISVGLNVYQNVYDSPFSSALSSTLNPAQVGQAVLLKVDLTGAPYNVATVSFLDGTTPLCTDTNAGSDSAGRLTLYCVATFATPGLHALTVSASNGAAVTTSNSVSENVVAAVPFDANQFALTGSWYNPSTSG